jgi:hypothetical protein
MQKLLNFDKYTFRASSASKLMVESSEKSGQEKLDECLDQIATKSAAIEKAVNKESKTCLKNKEELAALQGKATYLATRKDDPKPLSETTIKYLIECYVTAKHGIKKDIHSKYFEKGKATEDAAIRFLEEVHDKLYDKCTLPRQYNEFIEGECDIRYFWGEEKTIIDIKNSWSLFTFQPKTIEKVNPDYKWQGICYLVLYGALRFNLVYCLMNMPDNLFEDECRRMLYQYGKDKEYSQEYMDAVLEFRKQCQFDHLTAKERVYDDIVILRDEETEKDYLKLCERIKACREWLNEYAKKEYIRCYGSLPEGVTLKEEAVKFVELVEVKNEPIVEVKLDSVSLLKNNPEFRKHQGERNQEIIPDEVEVKLAPVSVLENFQKYEQTESESPLKEFVDVLNEHLSITVNKETTELITEDIVSKQTLEETVFSMLQPAINACSTKEELMSLYELNKESCEKYQSVANEFSNKDKDLTPPFEVSNSCSLGEVHTEDKCSILLKEIEELKSEKDCMDKYKEIRFHFDEFPILKEKLTIKKDSFKVSQPRPSAAPKPAPVASPVQKEEIKPASPINVVVPEQKSDVDIEDLKRRFNECKTVDEVIVLSKENAAILRTNREIHTHAMIRGDELNRKSLQG